MHLRFRIIIAGACLIIVAFPAFAQLHKCSARGVNYYSDRPCPLIGKTHIRAIGPARQHSYSSRLPDAPKAQEHLKYMGSGCASISEAIRTGPTRGVRGDVIRALRAEYSQKCSLEEQDARRLLQQDKSQEQRMKVAERDHAAAEQHETKERRDYCARMRDVIGLKRKREARLNAKEVDALRQLETSYNGRCIER